jgi:hypothetical protein
MPMQRDGEPAPVKWTRWLDLAAGAYEREPLFKERRGSVPGCYQVRAVVDAQVSRVKAPDPLGLLYMGETGNLRNRIRAFARSAFLPNCRANPGGRRYYRLLRRSFPMGCLRIRWCQTATKKGAKAVEAKYLHLYEQRFGELPPLNHGKSRSS